MWAIYHLFKNYGLSIIIFTLVSKIIIFPTTLKQQRGQAKMTALQPRINAIRKQYANNSQKAYEEQQKLYKQEGYNQFASCLPALIQFPVLIGVLDVVYRPLTHILRLGSDTINKAAEILKTVFIAEGKSGYDATLSQYADLLNNFGVNEAAIKARPELAIMSVAKNEELSSRLFSSIDPDFVNSVSSLDTTFFGVDLNSIPSFTPEVWTRTAILLALIPILSGVVQLVMTIVTQRRQKKLNAEVQGGGCLNVTMYFFPVFSVWLALNYPAGVGFYWIFSSLFSFLIMIAMNAYYNEKRTAALIERDKAKMKDKKPSRFQQMLDQQRELMQQQQNGVRPSIPEKSDEDKLSRSEMQAYNRRLINEARKRMAEKYGDEYTDTDKDKE